MPFNRFLAFGSNVFDIHVLYRVYFSTCSLMFIVWVLPIRRRSGFKKLDSKTIGCSIQSFFEISGSFRQNAGNLCTKLGVANILLMAANDSR